MASRSRTSRPSESISSIYRKAADGTGEAERVFSYTPGAGMVLTDWSTDNKFMTFFTGVIVLVPIGAKPGGSERKEIDWLREDYDAGLGRFSPDNRYIAYLSNEADVDRGEVYVRPFDPSKPDAPLTGPACPGLEGRRDRHDHVAAGRQGTLLHDPQLGGHGG